MQFFLPSDVGHPFLMLPLTKLLRGPVIGGFIFTICYSNSGRAPPKMHALVGTNLVILFLLILAQVVGITGKRAVWCVIMIFIPLSFSVVF